MPVIGTDEEASGDVGGTAALGVMNGMPGLNFFMPGITEGIAAGQADALRNAQLKEVNGLALPEFQGFDDLHNSYAGDVKPTLYGSPEAAQYALANESPEGRAAMLGALNDLSRVTDQSVGSNQAARRYQAEQDARQVANSREQAIKQDAARRGRVGGAADMLSRQQAAQAAANQNLSGGLQSAQQAALEELAGTQAKGALGGQLRAGDQAAAFNNADIINKFNMYNTATRNAASQHNADAQSAAAMANRDAFQNFLNSQTGLGMAKRTGNNANAQRAFENQAQKIGMRNNVLGGKIGDKRQNAKGAREAGQEEWQNQKDTYEMMMSFMGGGGGGMMGGK